MLDSVYKHLQFKVSNEQQEATKVFVMANLSNDPLFTDKVDVNKLLELFQNSVLT